MRVVFICSLGCRVRPDKELEFLGSIERLMERTRRLRGCSACRIVAELRDQSRVTLVSEWSDREALDRYFGSDEYRILRGMHILLEDEQPITVDEVVARAQLPPDWTAGGPVT